MRTDDVHCRESAALAGHHGPINIMYGHGHTYSKSKDQPGKVASPARGQLNRKNKYFTVRVRA